MSGIFTAKDMKDAAMAGNQVPKCTSWLGHKFEARYSKSAAVGGDLSLEGSSVAVLEFMEKRRTITYVHDICVRCGFVVEHKTDKSSS